MREASFFYSLFKEILDPICLFFLVIVIAVIFRSRKKISRLLLVSPLIVLYLASIGPTSFLLMKTIQRGCDSRADSLNGLDAVVILGAGARDGGLWNDGQLAEETSFRLLQGLEVFRAGEARFLVLSGGVSAGRFSEAEVMGHVAVRLGVPAEKIVIEGKSGNTRQHAPELRRLGLPRSAKIGIVTSAVHMRRSEMNFRPFFDNPVLLPVGCLEGTIKLSPQMLVPGIRPLNASSSVFYEILGMIKDTFLGARP
ncbi:MAG: YdcF family protein [Deltaproteobacteria bacterium]|nr:YdcF family protein [Deltaproteobacteria bacterium]